MAESTPSETSGFLAKQIQKRTEKREKRRTEKDRQELIKNVQQIRDTQGQTITNPIARFNLNLDGNNEPQKLINPPEGTNAKPEAKIPEKLHAEMSSSHRLEDPLTGQKFGVVLGNWETFDREDPKPVIVSFALYGNARTQKNGRSMQNEVLLRDEQIAHLTGLPVMGIDYPNVGASDHLRMNQLATDSVRSYAEIARSQLRMIAGQGIKEIHIVGQSMGTFAGITVAKEAAALGIKVNKVVLIEAVGVEKMPAKELAMRDMEEFGVLDVYSAFPNDLEMARRAGLHKRRSPLRSVVSQAKAAIDLLKRDPGFIYERSMAEKTMPSRVEATLDSQERLRRSQNITDDSTDVIFINGMESTVSPIRRITELLETMKRKGFGKQVQNLMYPGEGHLTEINAIRQGSEVAFQITGKRFPEPQFKAAA